MSLHIKRGDMMALFKYLKGCHSEEGQELLLILPEYRTHNNGFKLQEVRFRLNIRKNSLNGPPHPFDKRVYKVAQAHTVNSASVT